MQVPRNSDANEEQPGPERLASESFSRTSIRQAAHRGRDPAFQRTTDHVAVGSGPHQRSATCLAPTTSH